MEDARKERPSVYEILRDIFGFANRLGKNGRMETTASAISQLLADPRMNEYFNEKHVLFLMDHSDIIFSEPMLEDAKYSRCYPENIRKLSQMEHQQLINLKQE